MKRCGDHTHQETPARACHAGHNVPGTPDQKNKNQKGSRCRPDAAGNPSEPPRGGDHPYHDDKNPSAVCRASRRRHPPHPPHPPTTPTAATVSNASGGEGHHQTALEGVAPDTSRWDASRRAAPRSSHTTPVASHAPPRHAQLQNPQRAHAPLPPTLPPPPDGAHQERRPWQRRAHRPRGGSGEGGGERSTRRGPDIAPVADTVAPPSRGSADAAGVEVSVGPSSD